MPRLLAKLVLVGGVGWWLILHYRDDFVELPRQDLVAGMRDTMHVAGVAFLCMAGVMLLVAAVDVPLALWQYARKHRMTKEEVRKEHRESEGDPQLKGRIRAMQRQAAQRRMMADVPKADVIVTNPTHYAVALRYSEQEGGAPRVLAKGADMVAAKIRELGAEHKIPMLEAPPLARALYRHTEIGHQIPRRCMRPWPRCWPTSTSCAACAPTAAARRCGPPTCRCRPTWTRGRSRARTTIRTRPEPRAALTVAAAPPAASVPSSCGVYRRKATFWVAFSCLRSGALPGKMASIEKPRRHRRRHRSPSRRP